MGKESSGVDNICDFCHIILPQGYLTDTNILYLEEIFVCCHKYLSKDARTTEAVENIRSRLKFNNQNNLPLCKKCFSTAEELNRLDGQLIKLQFQIQDCITVISSKINQTENFHLSDEEESILPTIKCEKEDNHDVNYLDADCTSLAENSLIKNEAEDWSSNSCENNESFVNTHDVLPVGLEDEEQDFSLNVSEFIVPDPLYIPNQPQYLITKNEEIFEDDYHNRNGVAVAVDNLKKDKKNAKPKFKKKITTFTNAEERFFQTKPLDKTYKPQKILKRHTIQTQTTETPFELANCNAKSKLNDEFKKHLRTQADDTYVCKKCGERFDCLPKLTSHLATRTCKNVYECKICFKNFKRRHNLLSHEMSHKKTENLFECSVCTESFCNSAELQQHLTDHNKERPAMELLTCSLCEKTFAGQKYLNEHMKLHIRKTFLCRICGKHFTYKCNYVTHLKLHSGEKRFPCTFCEKRFSQKDELKRHTRTHTGEKPFQCQICNKSFICKSRLKIHERVHTGERPYRCQTCNKTFVTRPNYTSHLKRLHVHGK